MDMADFVVPLVIVLALVLVLGWRRARRATTIGGSGREFLASPRQLKLREFKNVIVADQRGTTEIDVIVVGNSGVFVVELKDFNAWIFGEEQDEMWTASYRDKSTHQFQNPLRQNFRHMKALQERLRLAPEIVQSVVSFTGNCEFKRPMPPNVVRGSYRGMIENAIGIRLTDTEVQRICTSLEALEMASTDAELDGHVAGLSVRFSSTTTCPKCGDALVIRRSRSAPADDAGFLGCRGFPRCRYTRNIDAKA